MGRCNILINILVLDLVLLSNYALSAHYSNDNENNTKATDKNRKAATTFLSDENNKVDILVMERENDIKDTIKELFIKNNIKSGAKGIRRIKSQINDRINLIHDDFETQHPETKRKDYIDIRKRSVEDEIPNKNATKEINKTKEVCIGAEEYCNMTREDYIQMLNNYIYPHPYEWALIATHTLVFIGGLLGNALVCVAVYRNHSMRTVTNYFIVNLAVADFLVILLCLPPTVLWDVTETWFFGAAMCKIILYFQSVSVTVSVLTLTFISVDRWYAICFPLKFKSTTGRAKVAIFVIWAVSLILNTPELVVLTTAHSVPLRFELDYLVQCVATWSLQSDLIWHIIKVVFIYSVPLLLMTVAYYQIVKVLWRSDKIPGQAETAKLAPAERSQLQSRRKAAKMLAAVVVMFAVCYFPVHLLSMLRYSLDMEQNDAITILALVSHVLCYANSAINPLIYNLMNGKFRREFRRAFCCFVPPVLENSTTLSRLTTSKKKPSEQVAPEKRSIHGYNACHTTPF